MSGKGLLRFATIGILVCCAATSAEALVIARESFDSYSAAGSFTADGGTGWAAPVAGFGSSRSPGLIGCFKSMANFSYTRDLDLSSPALDPYVTLSPMGNRVIGGAGVVVWTSFHLRIDSPTGPNSIVGFRNAEGFVTRFDHVFMSPELGFNGGTGQNGSVPGSDLTAATHVVAKWVYTAYRGGQLLVWVNPTATSEAGLGPPDGTTPSPSGFIESFNQVEFGGGGYEVDDLVIATSYEEATGGSGCNVPDGEQAGYATSASLEQVVAVNPGDSCTLTLWVGKRSDGVGSSGRWYVQLTSGWWYITTLLNGTLTTQSDQWVEYTKSFTVPGYPAPVKLRLKGEWGFESFDDVRLACGAGELISNGSFESPLTPDGTWTTGSPGPDDWTPVGYGAGVFDPNTTQMNDFF